MDIQKEKKLIDTIVNRLNPSYKKEIVDIPDSVVPKELFTKEELRKAFNLDNLRGLGLSKKDFPTCNIGNSTIESDESLIELPKMHLGSVYSIIKIDENTIACGGDDKKITLLDISDKKSPKAVATYMALEESIYEVVNESEWKLVNKNGWSFGNDEQLYRYARLYDPKSKELVPYYLLSEKRVKLSDDKTELVISKRFKRLNNINFAKD